MRTAFAALADLPHDEEGTTIRRETRHGLDTLSVSPAPRATPMTAEAPEGEPGTAAAADAPVVIHLHGGGYVFGSPDTHARLARVLCRASGVAVHVPAYPLAPERTWPAPLEAVLAWLPGLLDGQRRFALSGDSAGGHLALSVALALPPPLGARLAGIALFSPNTSRDYARSESRRANAERDAMNDPDDDDRLAALAFGGTDARSPAQNLLQRDLVGLPSLWIDVGTAEVLLDDSLLLARAAALADVDVTLRTAPGAFHLRQLFAQHWPAADETLERAGRWLGGRLCKHP